MITVDESRIEETVGQILELLEQLELDPLEAIGACADTINELAHQEPSMERDTVLDWAARRIE